MTCAVAVVAAAAWPLWVWLGILACDGIWALGRWAGVWGRRRT